MFIEVGFMKETIRCPICGKEFELLSYHLRKHNITVKDFKKIYPDVKLVTDSMHEKNSKRMREISNRPEVKENVSKTSKSRWSDESFRKKMEIVHKEVQSDKNLQERKSKALKKTWENPEFREDIINKQLEAQKRPEVKERKSEAGKRNWENPEYRSKIRKHRSVRVLDDGTEMIFASSWEVDVSIFLDEMKIPWKYEFRTFDYKTRDGKDHKYFPDFYIEDGDFYLEVKPKHETADEVNTLKLQSVRDSGYVIEYITQDDIEDIDTFKNKFYEVQRLSKATIQSKEGKTSEGNKIGCIV